MPAKKSNTAVVVAIAAVVVLGGGGAAAFKLMGRSAPPEQATVLAPFHTVDEVAHAVPKVVNSGVAPLILEYIDGFTMAAITHAQDLDLGVPAEVKEKAQAYLLVMLESGHAQRLDGDIEQLGNLLTDLGFQVTDTEGDLPGKVLTLNLKYGPNRERSIAGVRRVSKPGLRVYAKSTGLPRVLGGLGIAIISSSSGLLTDRQAAKRGVGGEVLAYVW